MKKALIVCLILALFILSACASGPNRNGEQISERDYRTGTKGIELEFVRNAPPDKIFSGDALDVIVEVRNEGAWPETDQFDGKLEIYGFDEKAFSGERWDGGNLITPALRGRNQFSPQGGIQNKQFHVDRVRNPFGAEFYTPDIIVAACYKYRTIAQPLVCIDPEPFTIYDEEKVCEIDANGETYSLGSQGAPVAVTRVTQETSSDQIHFTIEIRNVGGGQVIDDRVRNECPFELDPNDVDRVQVRAKLPFDGSPRCQPRGDARDPVRLDNGRGVIFCSFDKPASKSAFETVMSIEVDYRYLDTIKKRLEIVNLDR